MGRQKTRAWPFFRSAEKYKSKNDTMARSFFCFLQPSLGVSMSATFSGAISRLGRIYAALVFALTMMPALAAEENETILVLSPAVQEAIKPLLKDYKPKSFVHRIKYAQEIHNPGNFGKLVYTDAEAVFEPEENGLIASYGSMAFRDKESSSAGRGLTLCGLIDLLGTGGGKSDTSSTSVFPVGKLFVPFGIKSSLDTTSRTETTAFSNSGGNPCAPSPGAEFSYQIEGNVHMTTSGLFGRTRDIPRNVTTRCKAAAGAKPASQYYSGFRGDALEVSCQPVVKSDDPPSTTIYIFLIDSGRYFMLSRVSADGRFKNINQFSEVEYSPQ
jgi:hypothetical protein